MRIDDILPFVPAALVLGLLLPALSLADIPIPGQKFRPRGPELPAPPPVAADTSQAKPVVVKRDALKHANIMDARIIKAKIIIPRSLLPGDKKVAIEKQSSIGSTNTIIAGIALSLAAVSCVFLLRKNKAGRTVAISMLVIASGIGIWSVAQADLLPGRPNGPRRPPEPAQPGGDSVILLEVVEDGDSITLVLPK